MKSLCNIVIVTFMFSFDIVWLTFCLIVLYCVMQYSTDIAHRSQEDWTYCLRYASLNLVSFFCKRREFEKKEEKESERCYYSRKSYNIELLKLCFYAISWTCDSYWFFNWWIWFSFKFWIIILSRYRRM